MGWRVQWNGLSPSKGTIPHPFHKKTITHPFLLPIIAQCPLPNAHVTSPIARCSLPMVHRLLPIALYTHRIATVGVNFFPLPGLAMLLVPLLSRIANCCEYAHISPRCFSFIHFFLCPHLSFIQIYFVCSHPPQAHHVHIPAQGL